MNRFKVKTEPKLNPGAWNSTIVSIYNDETVVGSYERNHPGWSEDTFYPFESNGHWHALYSSDYTATRVMSLPTCKDIGGEEPASNGFCPVEFYVPCYRTVTWIDVKSGKEYSRKQFDNSERFQHASEAHSSAYKYGPWQYLLMGFVAGCRWGDDSSWKVESFDLSRAAEGIIQRSARFGHFELPHKKSLKDCIDFMGWTPEDPIVSMIRQEERNLNTGSIVDPYDR